MKNSTKLCIDNDAEIVEINPLAETEAGDFVALDARMVIDDNALFRHPEYAAKETQALSPQEALALKNNLAYVKLDGDIGVVGNGAGLVMATLDLLNFFGGKPANFLDLGGGATIEAIAAALQIVFAEPDTKVILVNVLGGITHCDDVARGIVEAANEAEIKKPLVVRLVGTNQQEGQKILANAGISVLDSMEEAAKQAVEIAMESATVMGIIINADTKAIVQGITGKQGSYHTKLMLDYGTKIVAGVVPGKGGTAANGVPVYDTVKETVEAYSPNASIIFVPAPFAQDAVLEAIANKIKTIVVITEHLPIKDAINVMAYADQSQVTIIGPNTPGIITPGQCKLGIMPANIFKSGGIGVVSRSGTLTYEIAAGLYSQRFGTINLRRRRR